MFPSFREPEAVGNISRMTYLSDLEMLIAREQENSIAARDRLFADYPANLETLRQKYLDMLGWPLSGYDPGDFSPAAVFTPIGSDDMADLFRVQVEVMPGLRFGGLLFRSRTAEKLPLVVVQHGGSGTPGLISGLYGDTANYNDMLRRVLARGVHVFAPQLLLWNKERYHIDYDRNAVDNQLKQLGGSITALEVYSIMRSIDVLSTQPWADADRIGMVGLSYGGFYTLFTAAADPRIRSALAAGFFNDRIKHNWTDWTWQNAAHTFLDAEVAALVAPRTLTLQLGTRDELFAEEPARTELARLETFFTRAGCPEKLSMEFFDGPHEFSKSDETIERFMKGLTE